MGKVPSVLLCGNLITCCNFLFQSEFICGLLKVVVQKLEYSIPQIIEDDNLFSHLIDELLLFNKELHVVHSYQSTHHSCLQVLASDACLQRWVELERTCKYLMHKSIREVSFRETVMLHWWGKSYIN